MAAPIDTHKALIADLREAFDRACPDVPLCKQKVAHTFDEIARGCNQDETDLFVLAMLAHDLGLELQMTLRAWKDKP